MSVTAANLWLLLGCWLAAGVALVFGWAHGALGLVALWSLPAVALVTAAVARAPARGGTRQVALFGLLWQFALVGAYALSGAAEVDVAARLAGGLMGTGLGQGGLPVHTVLLLGLIGMLLVLFAVLYAAPALRLAARLGAAADAAAPPVGEGAPAGVLAAVDQALDDDPALRAAWLEYRGQLRRGEGQAAGWHAQAGAARFFDLQSLTHARLRLDVFRNLPGLLTGIGIVGTFMGLIAGLRNFRPGSADAAAQRSMESLLTGVMEAFVVTAVAMAAAVVVTLLEKLLMSLLALRVDALALRLDGVFPPRPAADEPPWVARVLQAFEASAQAMARYPRTGIGTGAASAAGAAGADEAPNRGRAGLGMPPLPPRPTSGAGAEPPPPPAGPGAGSSADWLPEMARHAVQANQAVGELARALPQMLGQQHELVASALKQQRDDGAESAAQMIQVIKTLNARLDNVLSGMEASGRKSLELVTTRLIQADIQAAARQRALVEQLGELVGRIELLHQVQQMAPSPAASSRRAQGSAPAQGHPGGVTPEAEGYAWQGATERRSRGAPPGPEVVQLPPLPGWNARQPWAEPGDEAERFADFIPGYAPAPPNGSFGA
jgi:hypothetical protein